MRAPTLPLIVVGALVAAAAGVRSALVTTPDALAPLLLAVGTGLLLSGLFLIGPGGGWGRTLAAFLAVGIVGGTLVALVVLGGAQEGADGTRGLILGLPPAAALVVYGLGLVPVVIFPLVFTLAEVGSEDDAEDVGP